MSMNLSVSMLTLRFACLASPILCPSCSTLANTCSRAPRRCQIRTRISMSWWGKVSSCLRRQAPPSCQPSTLGGEWWNDDGDDDGGGVDDDGDGDDDDEEEEGKICHL
eukprot:9484056-Pyramimonas_sp.AAC.1